MLVQAIGAALPAALAVALSPFPLIGIVLLLAGAHGRRNGLLFAVGWIIGLAALAAVVAVVLGGADNPDSTSSAIADWLRVLAGATLIMLAGRKWWLRPRGGEETKEPGWMTSLGDATAVRALTLGVLLSGANPKNFVLTASATTAIIETDVHGTDLAVALTVFVLLGSCAVAGAVAVHWAGGQRAASFLDGVRQFMVTNNNLITMVVLLILGASILGDGLTGLGR